MSAADAICPECGEGLILAQSVAWFNTDVCGSSFDSYMESIFDQSPKSGVLKKPPPPPVTSPLSWRHGAPQFMWTLNMCGVSDCSHNRDAAPGEAVLTLLASCFDLFWQGLFVVFPQRLTWAREMSSQLFHGEVWSELPRVLVQGRASSHSSYLGKTLISRLRGSWLLLTAHYK